MKRSLLVIFLLFLVLWGSAQSITEVIYPRYVQGVGSGSPANDLKVPYACRMTLTGLTAGATYRYYSRFVDNPSSQSNGIGSLILVTQSGNFIRVPSPSLSVAGSYGEFTTNASGSYTGWFVVEPGSDIAFSPGTQLYWRIVLNNGSGGALPATRLTATNPVTVINWGTTSGAALEGSAIYNITKPAWTAKNFVMLYDNINGTGRPISGTFIESDGTVNTSMEGYDLFYEFFADGQAGVWGTIIPNNLANGINNISQYALSNGNFLSKCTSPNGVYGATDTRNASKGNADPFTPDLLVIDCTPNAGCNISSSTSVTNVKCNGASSGAVNLTVSGGVAPLTYSWSNGAVTEDINNVPAGTYTVTVTDATSCITTATAIVTQPTALIASSVAGTISCNGGTTTVTVSATGGVGPYNGTGTFTVGAGTYNYTVTDANECTSITTVTITQPAVLTANSTSPGILCNGGTTTVTVSATGGTAPYAGTGTFTVSAGTYNYTVTDNRGCTAVTTVTVTQPSVLTAASSAPPIGSVGGTTTVTVSATGGTAPYSGTGTFVRSAGTYIFTVADANGCTATTTITLTDPGCSLALSSTVTNITCNGINNGAIDLTITGASAPVVFNWTNGATTEDINNLAAGTYTVTVTDAVGCIATTTATVTQPPVLTVSASGESIACNGQTTTITVAGSGGTVPYSGIGVFIVTAGSYNYTISDANGCTAITAATVTQPAVLTASSSAGVINCNGGTTTVIIAAAGGTAPYNGAGSFTVNAGTYNYTVTDAAGCTAVTSITVTQPVVLTAASTAGTINCNGGTTTVNVTATGGTAPFAGTGSFTAGAGTHTYTVTDSKGCIAVTSVTITEPPALSAFASNGIIACNGGTANVIITANGGTAPYSGTGSFSRGIGTHNFTVSDAKGCTAATSVTISSQPSTLTAVATAGTITQCGGTTQVVVAASGGTSPYPYPGVGTYIRGPGTWSFTVTDDAGCIATTQVTIAAPECLKINPNPSGNIIKVHHSIAAGTTSNIVIYSINGARLLSKAVQSNTVVTTINISKLAAGTYVLAYFNGEEKRSVILQKLIN